MSKTTDKLLRCMAAKAESAFINSMGLASRNGAYEPKLSDEAKAYKANHTSKIEIFFNKLSK